MEIKKIPNQIIKKALIPLTLKNVDSIAFHHMAHSTWNVKDVEKYHIYTNGWDAIGYNYWIAFDGTVYEGRGLNKGAGVSNHNSHIISIGLQGDFEIQIPTNEQYESARELVYYIKEKIPGIKNIGCHKDWNVTACPGKYFDIKRITEVKELTSVNDIVWELSLRGLLTDKALWLEKLEEDINTYWLARKFINYLIERGV